jgi:hypothetical protein
VNSRAFLFAAILINQISGPYLKGAVFHSHVCLVLLERQNLLTEAQSRVNSDDSKATPPEVEEEV